MRTVFISMHASIFVFSIKLLFNYISLSIHYRGFDNYKNFTLSQYFEN